MQIRLMLMMIMRWWLVGGWTAAETNPLLYGVNKLENKRSMMHDGSSP